MTQTITDYTPEPWSVCSDMANVFAPETDTAITNVEHPCAPQPAEQHANARRIVAAVNACAGIPTEALDSGIIAEMITALEAFVKAEDWYTRDIGMPLDDPISDAANLARAAIAKAKGGAAQ